ncbi:tetratricopeptide repeat protein [Altererythrobacter salegens]|uniref:Tetratricopeptide repeat protein n=1 Tax=Croceibacterium salegens TaxID=1737568 RepID=A0A6I4SZT5_9SPHN|nr:tetratricopeptide repeat protein [Croceibacterium salegens]MXO60878.1 tetratricopeptide repeat protein [Croceibacterium salegens]
MKSTLCTVSRIALAGVALAGALALSAPASAQSTDEARLRKIEAEVRALQRTVFPNGDGRFFTPEVITPNGAQPANNAVGSPSETAVTDILARLDALEAQLQRLTARSEENANKISELQARLDAMGPATAVAANPAPEGATLVAAQPATSTASRPSQQTPAPKPTPAPTPAPKPTPAASAPSAARVAAVKAIEKPMTDDPGDDEYVYGFRLWDAKFYPEAAQQLQLFVDKYPNHSRISFGLNLLGRAYLDDGQPRTAATYFYKNYTEHPDGARGADSLLFLADSMIALKDTPRACRALATFGENFPALATGRLQEQYDRNRKAVKCS